MHTSLTHLVGLTSLVMLTATACRDDTPAPNPTSTSLTPKLDQGPAWDTALTYGARYDAAQKALVVFVDIAPGFHAYTEGETIGKPLLLGIAADSEVTLGGAIQYPKGVTKDLPVGRSVIVERHADIVAPLADPVSGKTARGSLRYQVCTETACDRPRTVTVAATVP